MHDLAALRAAVSAAPLGAVTLRCRDSSRILVRGPVTGLAYEFSPRQPTSSVDRRDAEMLLRTGRFVRG